MFRLVVVLSCVAAAIAANIPVDEKIIGGETAAKGQFPYQVSIILRKNGQHHCGGTIMNSRIIITAAHCVYEHPVTDFIIVVGTNALSGGGQFYDIANAVSHGSFDPLVMNDDIALLKTSQDIQFSQFVSPLPLQSAEVPVGASLVLSGWGLTSYPGFVPPEFLQFANLIAIDIKQCAQELLPGFIYNTQLCTFTRRGHGACTGDSGGPLVYKGRLAGVVSWGRPCAIGYPDVFTKVSAYLQWIQQTSQTM